MISICGFEGMCARVAQWWSIALPRRGSRVRIPSRALNDTIKEISVGYLLFCMFEPCRARTVRMSAFHFGRRRRTSPGRSATSRAFNDTKKRYLMDVFFCMFKPCRARTVRSLGSASVVAGERPRTFCDVSCSQRYEKEIFDGSFYLYMFKPCRARMVQIGR